MSKVVKSHKLIRCLLILGSILAAVKLILVDYTLDEEYQIAKMQGKKSSDLWIIAPPHLR